MRVEAADDVRVERQEVLDVAAVARQVAQLLLVEAARDRLALERDVVLPFGGHGDHVLEAADFELQVGSDDRRGAQHDAGALHFLEAAERRRHRVGAGAQVRDLEQPLARRSALRA